MDRRTFFKASAVVIPVMTVSCGPYERAVAGMPAHGSRRISCRKGDPGEPLYGMVCSDDLKAKVFLDGVEQKEAITADEELGMVIRHRMTPKGRISVNYATKEALEETVYGRVVIEIVE